MPMLKFQNAKKTYLLLLLVIACSMLSGCVANKPAANQSSQPSLNDAESAGTEQAEFVEETSPGGIRTGNQPSLGEVKKVQVYTGTGLFVKESGQNQSSAEGDAEDGVVLNFESADLREVVKVIIGDLLQSTFIISPNVSGTISLNTSKPIQRNDLLPTLETLLRMNGAAILLEAGIYKIVPLANAVRGSLTPQLGGGNAALNSRGFKVQLAPLKYIAASEMAKILEPFASDSASVRVDETRNLIIMSGTQRELEHLQETIDMFDVNWLEGMSVGLYTLQSVDVNTAVAELELIFGKENKTPVAGLVKLVPIERLNAVLAISSQPSYLKHVELWVSRFDRNGGSTGGTRLFIYQVQNGQAEKLADLLNNVFGGKAGARVSVHQDLAPGLTPVEIKSTPEANGNGPATPLATLKELGAEQEIRVIADKDNNALLILAKPADYETIEAAIRQLDVIPRQVLIDVTIAEVHLIGDLQYGLEWAFNNGSSLDKNVKLDVGPSGIGALVPGFSYVWGDATGIDAAFNMLANDSRVNVISSPHVMVTDNQTASINVGDQVPTTSQTQSLGGSAYGIISSIQYIDTGVILSVTPRINAGGLVTMEIDQEVSSAAVTTTSGIDSPTISSRNMKTTVVVKSGETVMLGGLITERKSNSSSGIPVLSKIPIIGGLFGAQSVDNDRIELVIMITPRMVANSFQAREVTREFREKMSGLAELLDEAGM